MLKTKLKIVCIACFILGAGTELFSQITERPRPAEWDELVLGGRFIDRFLPMPAGISSKDTWGAAGVVPRYVDNGIESSKISYWGGNILRGDDGKYHLFVCGWLESSPRGHHEWGNSTVYHAVSDNPAGSFVVKDTIGKGHNPEAFRLRDGRYVISVIDRYYIANTPDGPWTAGKLTLNTRGRRTVGGLDNQTFVRREDGSFLMTPRHGDIWVSEDGLATYSLLSDKSIYPPVAGEFEDPVIWRDHVQYHLIVNDWLGRIAFYQRSKDGITWVTDPGEAYTPGVSKHEDGYVENWFKYERMKVYQDEYGRAVQANFAVIDVLKGDDKGSDNHSSKNITIPLNPGLLLTITNRQAKTISVKIAAEKGFNPHTDIDLASLRFGASTEVNFGRGAKVQRSEKSGSDLIVTFDAANSGITADEFAPKLIGKTPQGKLLYGYARLPDVSYIEPILSALKPVFTPRANGFDLSVEVQNFGQVAAQETTLSIAIVEKGNTKTVGSVGVPALKAYEKTNVFITSQPIFEKGVEYEFALTISSKDKSFSSYRFKTIVF